jgi:hypothetical protein
MMFTRQRPIISSPTSLMKSISHMHPFTRSMDAYRRLQSGRPNDSCGNSPKASLSKAVSMSQPPLSVSNTSISSLTYQSHEFTHAPSIWNLFPFLVHMTEPADLSLRLRSYSNTFGIIGALLCTLSITALTMMPISSEF